MSIPKDEAREYVHRDYGNKKEERRECDDENTDRD